MFCVYWDSCPPGAVLLVDTAGRYWAYPSSLDPLETSPTTLDQQVPRSITPRPTAPSIHNNIFFMPLDGNQIPGKVASHSPKMETKSQTG